MPKPYCEFTIHSDYVVIDRAPLSLEAGDQVKIGPLDAAWKGWVWVNSIEGRGSYVPEELVEDEGNGFGTMKKKFDARDLSVHKGDTITSLREVRGWHWCRNSAGKEGWLPSYLLND